MSDELPLRWTTEKPTVPGWYWWKEKAFPAEVVQLVERSGQIVIAFGNDERDPLVGSVPDARWLGPLPEHERGRMNFHPATDVGYLQSELAAVRDLAQRKANGYEVESLVRDVARVEHTLREIRAEIAELRAELQRVQASRVEEGA